MTQTIREQFRQRMNGQPAAKQLPLHPIKRLARLYHACAQAFGETSGIPLREVLKEHQGVATALFIDARRAGLSVCDATTLEKVESA